MATWVQTSQLSKILDAIKTALAKKLEASGIKNNLTTEDSGYVLDARAGKTLGDRATALETKISSLFFETDSAGRWGYKSSKNGAVTPFEATGGASTIQTANLTGNRALVSNSNGKVAVAETTATEMGYLHGVTSGVQGQINSLNSNLANFQHGVDALYNQIVSLGVTPSGKTLDAVKNSISTVSNNSYNTGYAEGSSDGYSSGYSVGVKNATITTVQFGMTVYNGNTGSTNAHKDGFKLVGYGIAKMDADVADNTDCRNCACSCTLVGEVIQCYFYAGDGDKNSHGVFTINAYYQPS